MGDIWLEENGIYHPVNIKTGLKGYEGQPNLVSIKKLINQILEVRIDSYYLLMIKFDIPKSPDATIVCETYFFDMLDYLEYVTYDAGPGQTMLKAKDFFENQPHSGDVTSLSILEKMEKLLALLKDGHKRLRQNRNEDMNKYRKAIDDYLKTGVLPVTSNTQKTLNLK